MGRILELHNEHNEKEYMFTCDICGTKYSKYAHEIYTIAYGIPRISEVSCPNCHRGIVIVGGLEEHEYNKD